MKICQQTRNSELLNSTLNGMLFIDWVHSVASGTVISTIRRTHVEQNTFPSVCVSVYHNPDSKTL